MKLGFGFGLSAVQPAPTTIYARPIRARNPHENLTNQLIRTICTLTTNQTGYVKEALKLEAAGKRQRSIRSVPVTASIKTIINTLLGVAISTSILKVFALIDFAFMIFYSSMYLASV